MSSAAAAEPATPWWGEWSFAPGQRRHWRIGPLELWIERQRHEWLLRRRRGTDPLDSSLHVATDAAPPEGGVLPVEVDRVAAGSSASRLSLAPRLADRTVIVRPRNPFHVLEGATVELFVSSPLWVRIASAPDGGELLELPTHRPSDTWFGASTRTGERAYAVSTSCRVDLEGLPVRPHRAVTLLRIENPGPGRLTFERIAVPVPDLGLYAGAEGRLWTEAMKLVRRDEGGGLADTEVLAGAPPHAGGAQRITAPRVTAEPRILRVFDALF